MVLSENSRFCFRSPAKDSALFFWFTPILLLLVVFCTPFFSLVFSALLSSLVLVLVCVFWTLPNTPVQSNLCTSPLSVLRSSLPLFLPRSPRPSSSSSPSLACFTRRYCFDQSDRKLTTTTAQTPVARQAMQKRREKRRQQPNNSSVQQQWQQKKWIKTQSCLVQSDE